MDSAIIIPARYKSSRYPGKPLVTLCGRPMIHWVAERCAIAVGRGSVFVATDDNRIADSVRSAGFEVLMTSENALTGTDRVAEAAEQIEADIILNVQGDEPLINPEDIKRILSEKKMYPDDVINGYCRIGENENPNSKNIPKVIFNEQRRMIYMSRLAIPGYKEKTKAPDRYYKQVCIYAFNPSQLKNYWEFGRKSRIEESEDIEILRFLELGINVRMVETTPGSLAVDVPEDVNPVENTMKRQMQ